MSQDKEIRPLGGLEQFSSSRHSLGFYRCVANTCAYACPSFAIGPDGSVQHIFEQALKDVILRLPSLRVGIKDEDLRATKFVQIDSIQVSAHLEWKWIPAQLEGRETSSILRVLKDQHDTPFPNARKIPPWRVVCIAPALSADMQRSPTTVVHVIFAVHHAIADGMSTVVFHKILLESLNKQQASAATYDQSGEEVNNLALPLSPALSPPVEKLIRFRLSWAFFLGTLWNEFAPTWFRGVQPLPPWTGKLVTLEPSHLNIRLVTIDSATLSQVLAACRAQETTLTGAIHAIVLASLASHLPEDQLASFVGQTPVNLRPLIDASLMPVMESAELMGTYVSAIEHTFESATVQAMRSRGDNTDLVEKDIWRAAKGVKTDIQKRRDMGAYDDPVGLLPWVSDFRQFWLKKLGHARSSTWEVSNLGVLSGHSERAAHSDEGEWKITQSMLTQSANIAGPAFSMNVAGVKDCGLSITLCWQETIVETALMDHVADNLTTWIGRISTD